MPGIAGVDRRGLLKRMDNHRAALPLGKRDVIGAWLVGLAVAAACLGSLGAAEPGEVDRAAATTNPGPTVAAPIDNRHLGRQC
jgi:hypothetical protein